MNYKIIILLVLVAIVLSRIIFKFIPNNKDKSVYEITWAHRGLHLMYPENTLAAYNEAIKSNLGIELDIRMLNGTIYCFHDRYTKRLLGIPGSFYSLSEERLKKEFVKNSKEKVCTLNEAMSLISGKVPVLIDVKGKFDDDYRVKLTRIMLLHCKNQVYFHTESIFTYFSLCRTFGAWNVFFVLNIFRKRFKFIKGRQYKDASVKWYGIKNDYAHSPSNQIPTIEDISEILVSIFENNGTVKEACAAMSAVFNKFKSRVNERHWLNTSLLLHRSIISSSLKENSIESFKAAIDFATKNNLRVALELDVIIWHGELICYHSDRLSSKLGQESSSAKKVELKDSVKFEDVVKLVKGHDNVSIIIDIKDYKYKNRILEQKIVEVIEKNEFKGNFAVQSFNPLVLMWFEKNRPDYIRGQVGHSLSGLAKYVPFFRFPWAVNVLLFNKSNADYAVYDNSNFIYILIKYNKDIKGRCVLVYAPKSYREIENFIGKEGISNFIVENVADTVAWPEEYLNNFKVK